jgi:protoporphyrinogen oxidase
MTWSCAGQYKGYRFDIGGHRFFTKIRPVESLWEELLGEEFLEVPAALEHSLRRASTSITR